jgi:hypothetical protein
MISCHNVPNWVSGGIEELVLEIGMQTDMQQDMKMQCHI